MVSGTAECGGRIPIDEEDGDHGVRNAGYMYFRLLPYCYSPAPAVIAEYNGR